MPISSFLAFLFPPPPPAATTYIAEGGGVERRGGEGGGVLREEREIDAREYTQATAHARTHAQSDSLPASNQNIPIPTSAPLHPLALVAVPVLRRGGEGEGEGEAEGEGRKQPRLYKNEVSLISISFVF